MLVMKLQKIQSYKVKKKRNKIKSRDGKKIEKGIWNNHSNVRQHRIKAKKIIRDKEEY